MLYEDRSVHILINNHSMIRKLKINTFFLVFLFFPLTIAFAQIDYVIIRDQSGGGGSEITNETLTTDETLTLYAAGYNNSTGYISDVSVNWSTTGTLDSYTHTGSSWIFSPATVGSGTIVADHATATDDATGTITVNPGVLASFTLSGVPSTIQAGASFPVPANNIIVTAYDGEGNLKTDYTGIVTWLSSDPYPADLPTDDGSGWTSGQKTFVGSGFTLYTTTSQTITVQDGAVNEVSGSITVTPAALGSFTLGNVPSSIQAGSSFPSPANDITITAFDIYNNQKTDYTGIVTWLSSDPYPADLPTDNGSGWSNGQKTFSGSGFTLYTIPSQTITVQDGAVSEEGGSITVTPAGLGSFTLGGVPSSVQAGQLFPSPANDIVVTAYDIYSNRKTDYTGTVTWLSSDPYPADLPTDDGSGWISGQKTFDGSTFTLYTTPSQTITVQDGAVNETSGSITVIQAAVGSFTISGVPTTIQAGQPFPSPGNDVVVTAFDIFNNQMTTYTGPVTWLSSDPYPADLPTDNGSGWSNGQKTFSGSGFTLYTTPSQTVTVQHGAASETSGSITVTPAALGAFQLNNVRSSVQAGQPFGSPLYDITVTAYDIYNNQKTNYTGTITWLSSDPYPANLPTDNGSGWTSGQKTFSGSGFVLYTAPSQTISVQHGAISKTSGFITVTPASVNDFHLSCNTSLTAGTPFKLDVTGAQDQYGNSWSGTIDISVIQGGGNSPNGSSPVINDIETINGNGNAYQTLYLAENNVEIQGHAYSVYDTVKAITVNPNILSSLKIRNAAGNGGIEVGTYSMNIGDNLMLYSAGYDPWGNYRNDENTNWSSSGLTPPVNTSNASNITFTPSSPGNGTITATDPNYSISDQTGIITVNPGTVNSFSIYIEGDTHRLGYHFPVTITALDAEDNIATGFTGRVLIEDLTGEISPDTSGYFTNGVWNGGVTVYREYTNDVITITELGGTATGTSGYFNIIPAPGIQISDFYPLQNDSTTMLSSVTTGQTVDWLLKMVVQNSGSDTVTLDSIRLNFIVGNVKQEDYSIVSPTVFLGNGTRYLPGQSIDSVLIKVDTTGNANGEATVLGFIYLGTKYGGTLKEDTLTTVSVQTPAQPLIYAIYTSQSEVTRSQNISWSAVMAIRNNGESSISVNPDPDSTTLSFELGSNWQITHPLTMTGGDWLLEGGDTDSILFTITHTGENDTGTCQIDGTIIGIENNTGRRILEDTQNGGSGTILIEDPPLLQITEVANLALNAPYVNTGQTFSIRIRIANNGGDGLHNAQLNLYSDGASSFTETIPPFSLAGNKTKTFEIEGSASYAVDPSEIFTADATGDADNTNIAYLDSNSPDDTTRAVIQNPAVLIVRGVYPSTYNVIGGQIDPWVIKVAVRNAGQAHILLNKPQSNDLTFLNNGIPQLDYKVDPDSVLKGGGRVLESGSIDTLIYRVHATGRLGGSVIIQAEIHGKDKNSNNSLSNTNQTSIFVEFENDFFINSTHIMTPNTTESGNGYVNTEQPFKVLVAVSNGLGQTISNIQIRLQTNGYSNILNSIITIPQLIPNSSDVVEFNVTADDEENLSGEKFTASIYQSTVNPGPSEDDTAFVFIQNPADLQLQLSLSNPSGQYSVNQTLTLQASLINQGTASVDQSGRVRIRLPEDFTLLSSSETSLIATGIPAQWSIRTPLSVDFEETYFIPVVLTQYPIEMNTNNLASVQQDSVTASVTVIQRSLEATVSIPSPTGASDRILSTDQNFVVKVAVQSHNCKNITALITVPSPFYKIINKDSLKSVISNEAVWQVTAPDVAMGPVTISVLTRGEDALYDGVYIEDVDNLSVTCVSKANLHLSLSVIAPPDAVEDGVVSLGQEFEVGAFLENQGDADVVGAAQVTLQELPEGYTTTEPNTKLLINGQTSWHIQAPDYSTGEIDYIEAELTTIPLDANTGESSALSRGSDKVGIKVEGAYLAVSLRPPSISGSTTIVPGQESVKLMALRLYNSGVEGANQIRIHRISFAVEDRNNLEISPNDVLSKLYVKNDKDSTIIYGDCQVPDTNRVDVFLNALVIDGKDSLDIAVYGNISENKEISYFQLNIPNGDYIEARDNYSNIAVPVKESDRVALTNLRSGLRYIYDPETEPILFNCPNPFGEPEKPTTDIHFYVKEASDIKFMIFTIIGELVYTKSYSADDLTGAAGSVKKWVWDGRNDKGLTVLNGIYYLFMEMGGTVVAKTKIAYVK